MHPEGGHNHHHNNHHHDLNLDGLEEGLEGPHELPHVTEVEVQMMVSSHHSTHQSHSNLPPQYHYLHQHNGGYRQTSRQQPPQYNHPPNAYNNQQQVLYAPLNYSFSVILHSCTNGYMLINCFSCNSKITVSSRAKASTTITTPTTCLTNIRRAAWW